MSLVDVISPRTGMGEIIAAFKVEKSASIYSGILRLEDLVRSTWRLFSLLGRA